MRARRRFSTNRINYIRQRLRNKVYDYANPILIHFHQFSEFFSHTRSCYCYCSQSLSYFFSLSLSLHSLVFSTLFTSPYSASFFRCFVQLCFLFLFLHVIFSCGAVRLFADGSSANSGREVKPFAYKYSCHK